MRERWTVLQVLRDARRAGNQSGETVALLEVADLNDGWRWWAMEYRNARLDPPPAGRKM